VPAVFQVGAAHGCREFWPQGYLISSPIGKGVHLLGYDIGFFTYAPGEKLGVFKSRDIKALIAIELANICYFLLYVAPVGLLLGQDI
jgi:hypothetical protein